MSARRELSELSDSPSIIVTSFREERRASLLVYSLAPNKSRSKCIAHITDLSSCSSSAQRLKLSNPVQRLGGETCEIPYLLVLL